MQFLNKLKVYHWFGSYVVIIVISIMLIIPSCTTSSIYNTQNSKKQYMEQIKMDNGDMCYVWTGPSVVFSCVAH